MTEVDSDVRNDFRQVSLFGCDWRRVGSVSAEKERKENERTRREEKAERKHVVVIRQAGKCIYRISPNGRTRPSGLSVLRVLSSVMFIIPHDGQLDLLLPSPVWRMRLIKSDKLIASTNCTGAIELSDDTALSEILTSNKTIALHINYEGLVKASLSRFGVWHNQK